MRKFPILLLSACTITIAVAASNYNTDKGYIAEGYDVVSYFSKQALEGKKEFVHTHDGVKFKFSSAANLKLFKANPSKYTPQYGGWCAYAMALKPEKVSINPKTFEIRDGKLYLFYNAWGVNTLKKWQAENPEKLRKQADVNWKTLISTSN